MPRRRTCSEDDTPVSRDAATTDKHSAPFHAAVRGAPPAGANLAADTGDATPAVSITADHAVVKPTQAIPLSGATQPAYPAHAAATVLDTCELAQMHASCATTSAEDQSVTANIVATPREENVAAHDAATIPAEEPAADQCVAIPEEEVATKDATAICIAATPITATPDAVSTLVLEDAASTSNAKPHAVGKSTRSRPPADGAFLGNQAPAGQGIMDQLRPHAAHPEFLQQTSLNCSSHILNDGYNAEALILAWSYLPLAAGSKASRAMLRDASLFSSPMAMLPHNARRCYVMCLYSLHSVPNNAT
ncbi:hypothetical protein GOP47_0007235 [Adiantum capillus-veneris]|uniref:Uncharacterized protein n=1 Tax=Adiantum capillus-veneris TaxID=13818 RepID=A0A9D4ZLB8_ADICA|nr:hypothetical protein GOP47_0007235 [Adiantum capillus-veneris]